ncbi:MAG: hypothetical protein KKD39_02460, partial [Candidatus Altiarchaeota archaeon]|nr:hypothetical protein [Candidatus Altiarchaeota archaeon]
MNANKNLAIKEKDIMPCPPFLRIEKAEDGQHYIVDFDQIPPNLSNDALNKFITRKAFGIKDEHLWFTIKHSATS